MVDDWVNIILRTFSTKFKCTQLILPYIIQPSVCPEYHLCHLVERKLDC